MGFEPRHVPAGTSIGYTDTDGSQVERSSSAIAGDPDYHTITPRSQVEADLLDSIDAPVARRAIEAKAARAKSGKSAKAAAASGSSRPIAASANGEATVTHETSAADPQPAESDGGS